MANKHMRAFIAIELPKEIKASLSKLQTQLKTSQADVKWVEPQNIHLTLKFLGEIDEKTLEKVSEIITDTAQGRDSFYLNISSLGAFPNINSPRVIWVGVNKGDNETKEIVKQLEEKISDIGIPKEERPFSSHITIGRTRSNLNLKKLNQILDNLTNGFKADFQEFLITKITLFKSTLTPKGPIYEAVKETNLKAI